MRVGAQESEQWQSNGVENRVESESRSKYEVNVIVTNNRVRDDRSCQKCRKCIGGGQI